MGEHHAKRDLVPAIIFCGKLGDESNQRKIEIELSTFVKDHRHRCSHDYLRNRGQIVNSLSHHTWGVAFIGEVTQALKSNQLSLMGNSQAGAWKNTAIDRLGQNLKRGGEDFILPLEGECRMQRWSFRSDGQDKTLST